MVGSRSQLRALERKSRVFIISDIANEPDDAESLVRYLLYANEFDTRGLVACTSTHIKRRVCPEEMVKIVNAYGEVVDNLNAHAHPNNLYPSAQSLLDMIATGPALYGREALEPSVPLSAGAELLIQRLEESTSRYGFCAGAAPTSAAEVQRIVSKLRVYTISDQDDTGLWMRVKFPDLFYICSIHGWSQYTMAAWMGISADVDGGSNPFLVSKEWYSKYIQLGPLGKVYPDHKFIVEGDTPTFLYLIPNGLGSPEHPERGSWGGRYIAADRAFAGRHYCDAVDKVIGKGGRTYETNYATIWRWRESFQNDFAARIQWTLTGVFDKANHAPVVIVNGSSTGPEPVVIDIDAGGEVLLDASASYDPDGDDLTYSWFQYREVTSALHEMCDPMIARASLKDVDEEQPGRKVNVRIPGADKCAVDFISGKPLRKGQELHYVLQVKDNGTPTLVTYKRVVIRIGNPDLRGGREIFGVHHSRVAGDDGLHIDVTRFIIRQFHHGIPLEEQ